MEMICKDKAFLMNGRLNVQLHGLLVMLAIGKALHSVCQTGRCDVNIANSQFFVQFLSQEHNLPNGTFYGTHWIQIGFPTLCRRSA